jgi:hypothetical protein
MVLSALPVLISKAAKSVDFSGNWTLLLPGGTAAFIVNTSTF